MRAKHSNSGVWMAGSLQVISLYANDILLYTSDPTWTVLQMLQIIEAVGEISRLRINWQKLEILPLGKCTYEDLDSIPPQKVPGKLKYLGIRVTHSPQTNCSIISSLEHSVDFWSRFPMSMLGRIALSKMIMLPRLLYVFQNVFCEIPTGVFKT